MRDRRSLQRQDVASRNANDWTISARGPPPRTVGLRLPDALRSRVWRETSIKNLLGGGCNYKNLAGDAAARWQGPRCLWSHPMAAAPRIGKSPTGLDT
jgi:hypothetical protein